MAVSLFIHVSFQWAATHRWPQAPVGEHVYLSNRHRHMFHGHVWIEVQDDNRELEYFEVLDFIHERFVPNHVHLGTASCEQVAVKLLDLMRAYVGDDRLIRVEILEDGENGSVAEWTAS